MPKTKNCEEKKEIVNFLLTQKECYVSTDSGDFHTPEKIIEAALKMERAAYDFYSRILTHSKTDIITELAEELKDEEYKHIKLIEKIAVDIRIGKHH